MKKQWFRAAAALGCGALLCTGLGALLGGCSSNKPQDGSYTARFQHPSSGYVEYLTVTFQNGKPTGAEFDAFLESDPQSRKSQTTREEYPMTPHPSEWMPQLAKNITAAGTDPDRVAGVAGATSSSRHARQLYNALLEAAVAGKTGETVVENEPDPANPDSNANSEAGTDSTGDSGTVGGNGDSATDGSSAMDSGSTGAGSSDTGATSGNNAGTNSGTGTGTDDSTGSAAAGGTETDSTAANSGNTTGGDVTDGATGGSITGENAAGSGGGTGSGANATGNGA